MTPHELVAEWRKRAEQKNVAAAAYEGQGKNGSALFARAEETQLMKCAADLEAALAADAEARAETERAAASWQRLLAEALPEEE